MKASNIVVLGLFGLLLTGIVSFNNPDPLKAVSYILGSSSQDTQPASDGLKVPKDGFENVKGQDVQLSEKTKQIISMIDKFQSNLNNTGILLFDISEFELEFENNVPSLFKKTIILNNRESLLDLFLEIIEFGSGKRRFRKQSGTSSSSSSPPDKAKPMPIYKGSFSKLTPSETSSEVYQRPPEQKKDLATLNCGFGKSKFDKFQTKHII